MSVASPHLTMLKPPLGRCTFKIDLSMSFTPRQMMPSSQWPLYERGAAPLSFSLQRRRRCGPETSFAGRSASDWPSVEWERNHGRFGFHRVGQLDTFNRGWMHVMKDINELALRLLEYYYVIYQSWEYLTGVACIHDGVKQASSTDVVNYCH